MRVQATTSVSSAAARLQATAHCNVESRANDVLLCSPGKCLYLSGLTPEPMTADDDYKLLNVGIGFTNMVERATKGSADLTRKEIKRGKF